MDNVQILLLVVVVFLTVLITVVGFQVFLMIMEARSALRKINAILDDSVIGGGLINQDKLNSIWTVFKKKKESKSLGISDAIISKDKI